MGQEFRILYRGFRSVLVLFQEGVADDAGPSSEEGSSGEEDGSWIDESNIDNALRKLGAVEVPETDVKVVRFSGLDLFCKWSYSRKGEDVKKYV